jgi:acyl-CoA thioester hydrolase
MSHFIHRLEVRFRDCDPMGHTNNAVYLTYLEQARFAHWRSLWGFGTPQPVPSAVEGLPSALPGVILARVECDYKRPTKYGDTLEIRLTVAAVGRTSFRYEYEIVDDQGRTVLTAKTVQVMYDYKAEKPAPIPDEIRALLQIHGPDRGQG